MLGWGEVLLRLLDDPSIASKRWVYRQYDHQVQANTVVLPGGADAAVIRLRPQQGPGAMAASTRGVAAVVDCPNRWVALDPERGAMAAVAEAARNLSCTGAEPLAVTDNLNFPSPDTATGYWQLAMACRGLSEACSALATPVTGGNVSLYNETRLPDGRMQPIHPTPVVGMVGLVHDLAHVTGLAWRQAGDAIWLLGVPLDESGDGSLGLGAAATWRWCTGSSRAARPWWIWPWRGGCRASCARPLRPVWCAPPTTFPMAVWRWRRRRPASPLAWGLICSCPPATLAPTGCCSPRAGHGCW